MNAPIDITGVTLKTPRLLLRPWRMDDLEVEGILFNKGNGLCENLPTHPTP